MNDNNKRKALGRGLEQLFSNESLYIDENSNNDIVSNNSNKSENGVTEVNIDELRSNPYQPRKNFDMDKLNGLADSIKEYGVLEPIIVTKNIRGYNIVAGERRVKASKIAGKTKIPVIVKDFNDKDMMEISLLENIQREDLNAIEEAEAYYNIIKAYNLTHEELAAKIGKDRTYVTNMLGLLNLPEEVKKMVFDSSLSMGHARVLSKIANQSKALALANRVVKEGLSVRSLEKLVSEEDVEKSNPIVRIKSNNYKYIENSFREKLGTKVKVSDRKIVIPFTSEKDLSRLLDLLGISVSEDE